MHARAARVAGAEGAQQLQQGLQGDGFGGGGDAGQAHAAGDGAAGGHACAQPGVLRAQPDGVAEGAGVLQGAVQHLRVDQGGVGLAEGDAAGFGQFGHFGELLASQAARERAQRQHARLVQALGSHLEHFNQARLVEHGVGVGRADQAGDAACNGCAHFAFQHAGVFVAWLAQACAQVDQARGDDAACGVQAPVGRETAGRFADGDDAACGNGDVGHFVAAAGRVNHTALFDEEFHGAAKKEGVAGASESLFSEQVFRRRCLPRCSALPCARRCRKSLAAG